MHQQSSPCTCLNLRRASKALTDVYDQHLMPFALSISQYSILRHIHYLAPVNVSDLSSALRLDRTTLVRSLKPLEEKGLIEDISLHGTRDRELCLTENGKEIYAQATRSWECAQTELEQYLGKEDANRFAELMEKIENYHG